MYYYCYYSYTTATLPHFDLVRSARALVQSRAFHPARRPRRCARRTSPPPARRAPRRCACRKESHHPLALRLPPPTTTGQVPAAAAAAAPLSAPDRRRAFAALQQLPRPIVHLLLRRAIQRSAGKSQGMSSTSAASTCTAPTPCLEPETCGDRSVHQRCSSLRRAPRCRAPSPRCPTGSYRSAAPGSRRRECSR